MNDMKLLVTKDLRMWFSISGGLFKKRRWLRAVDGVNLELKEGETLTLAGESGCGKTTLGKTILRLYKPTSGKIIYKGRDITNLNNKQLKWYRREAQVIHQDPFSSLNPFFTIFRILEEPLIIHNFKDKDERREIIFRALEEVKLTPVEEFVSKYPHMLSGGQRQRVVIARALILRPKFIVADEPISMLDASIRVEILYLLKELQKKYGITFLYITHDIATAKYFSEKIAIMYAGKIVERGRIDKIISEPLHPYTEALLAAIPDPDPSNRFKLREVPSGEPPNLVNPPPGCRFWPRCPKFIKGLCDTKEPKLVSIGKENREVACHLYS